MNAAVADFKFSGDTSKKIQKSKFEKVLNNNIEFVPDILKDICKKKKENQIFVGFVHSQDLLKMQEKQLKRK